MPLLFSFSPFFRLSELFGISADQLICREKLFRPFLSDAIYPYLEVGNNKGKIQKPRPLKRRVWLKLMGYQSQLGAVENKRASLIIESDD